LCRHARAGALSRPDPLNPRPPQHRRPPAPRASSSRSLRSISSRAWSVKMPVPHTGRSRLRDHGPAWAGGACWAFGSPRPARCGPPRRGPRASRARRPFGVRRRVSLAARYGAKSASRSGRRAIMRKANRARSLYCCLASVCTGQAAHPPAPGAAFRGPRSGIGILALGGPRSGNPPAGAAAPSERRDQGTAPPRRRERRARHDSDSEVGTPRPSSNVPRGPVTFRRSDAV
jgi:hypothetical protein